MYAKIADGLQQHNRLVEQILMQASENPMDRALAPHLDNLYED